MNSKLEERKKFIINVLYFAISAALLYFAVKYVLKWTLPFLIGFIVALVLKPAIGFLSKKCRFPNKAAAVILVLFFYAVVGVLLFLIGAKIIYSIQQVLANLPSIYSLEIEPLIKNLFESIKDLTAKLDPNMVLIIQNASSSFYDSAGSVVTGISTQAIKYLSSTVVSLPGFLLALLLAVISSVFFAMDYKIITVYIMKMLPEKMQSGVKRLKILVSEIVLKYIKSYAILVSVTFIELSIGLMILGVDKAIAVAAVIAMIDLLPVLGTGGVVIPWVIIELIKGNYPFATGLAILYIIITIVRNILEPKIVGQQIGIHPIAMLMSMYVGLKIFGFIGIFVLPILLVVIKGFRDGKRVLQSSEDNKPNTGKT